MMAKSGGTTEKFRRGKTSP